MPKLEQSSLDQKRCIVRGIIKKGMEFCDLRDAEIAKRIQCKDRTFRYRKQKPETLRLADLWTLSSLLKLTDEEILQIIRGKKEVGTRG